MPESILRPRRTTAALLALLAPALLLAGCGGDEVGAKPVQPSETPALWNPCDALDARFIKAQFGSDTTEHDGASTAPECRFAPAKGTGQAAITANYQLFSGNLDDFWQQMGAPKDADVRNPKVPGADAARIVVAADKRQLYITGFVQNGQLFELVNVVDPAPYDQKRLVRGTVTLLGRLSAHAVDKDAGAAPSSATG